jgi:hypothetical protein
VAPSLRARIAPWAVAGCAVVYPLVVLAGGSPHFPQRTECVQPAHGEGKVDAVFGRFRETGEAESRLQRATELGFQGLQLERDGCGDVKVVLEDVPSLEVGRDLAAEAARVGLHVMLEQPSP